MVVRLYLFCFYGMKVLKDLLNFHKNDALKRKIQDIRRIDFTFSLICHSYFAR